MKNEFSDRLYKYHSITKNTLEIFIKNKIYFSKPNQFNDPFDTQLSAIEFANEIKELGLPENISMITQHEQPLYDRISHYGIYCLSEEYDNMLMWSHYADAHRGICLGFKKEFDNFLTTDCMTWLVKVNYSQHHPFEDIRNDIILGKFNPIDNFEKFCNIHSALEKALIEVKHENWRYEKEQRVVSHISGLQSFNPEALECVILGMNISREDKLTIRSLLTHQKWQHVQIFKAKRRKGELALDIEKHD